MVVPLSPPAPYLGGKRNLADRVVARINSLEHTCYAEPFMGMGGIFFKRTKAPKLEVVNDKNSEVSNFFKILQRHPEELLRILQYHVTSRQLFYTYRDQDTSIMTDIERAARFYYLQRLSFGGKSSGQSFGVQSSRERFNIKTQKAHLESLHDRMAGVTVECLNYDEILLRYDSKGTLFYLDPPYYNCEKDYGKDLFGKEDFECIRDILKAIKGVFIMSLNDTPEVREIYKDFFIEAVETTYSIAANDSKKVGEVIISNTEAQQFSLV